mmetsp:Transcript_415/g.1153  ORF Transcript_415/g.1153 Transcript_415/m.1153 type:complete len:201 (-) Transcript_415:2053-2655(-)
MVRWTLFVRCFMKTAKLVRNGIETFPTIPRVLVYVAFSSPDATWVFHRACLSCWSARAKNNWELKKFPSIFDTAIFLRASESHAHTSLILTITECEPVLIRQATCSLMECPCHMVVALSKFASLARILESLSTPTLILCGICATVFYCRHNHTMSNWLHQEFSPLASAQSPFATIALHYSAVLSKRVSLFRNSLSAYKGV